MHLSVSQIHEDYKTLGRFLKGSFCGGFFIKTNLIVSLCLAVMGILLPVGIKFIFFDELISSQDLLILVRIVTSLALVFFLGSFVLLLKRYVSDKSKLLFLYNDRIEITEEGKILNTIKLCNITSIRIVLRSNIIISYKTSSFSDDLVLSFWGREDVDLAPIFTYLRKSEGTANLWR